MTITLIEMTAAVDAAGSTTALRYSSGAEFMTRPTESPPNAVYEARLMTAGNYERHCWARGTTTGASQRGYGVVELNNSDGALDALLRYGFDGQPITIRRGPEGGAYPDDFPAMFSGVMSRVTVDWQKASVLLLDRQSDMADKSYQGTKFDGSNSGATGVEGTASDIKGNPKPKLRGTANNFAPPCANTSDLVYQIDDGTAKLPMTLTTVYDKGGALTVGTSRATLALLKSNTPSASHYDYYAGPDGWYFKLGSTPSGTITCDASEGAAADRTVAQIVSRIVSSEGGIPLADIDGIAALDAACPYEVGIWVGEETTVGQVVDAVLASVNGFLVDSRTGRMKLGRFVDPATLPSAGTIEEWQIKGAAAGLKISGSNDPGVGLRVSDGVNGGKAKYKSGEDTTAGLPVYRALLEYDRNFTVQSDADVAGVAQSRLAVLKEEYRTVDLSDRSILLKHKKAPEYTVTTLLRSATDAAAEAARQLALRKVASVIVEIPLDPETAADFDLAQRVDLMLARFGFDAGIPLFILGITEDLGAPDRAAMTTLICWGQLT